MTDRQRLARKLFRRRVSMTMRNLRSPRRDVAGQFLADVAGLTKYVYVIATGKRAWKPTTIERRAVANARRRLLQKSTTRRDER